MEKGWNRRDVLRAGAALALTSGMPAAARAPETDRRPNVLFVLSDSHRASSTGCYGNDQILTPHFDAFAAQGTRLTTAISNTPLCRPYRASFMTGAYAHQTGMVSNKPDQNFAVDDERQWRPGELPTFGETFAAAGYRCGYIGKWHLGAVDVDPGPLRFGFDDYWLASKWPAHDYFRWTYYTGRDQTVTGDEGYRVAFETDHALEFIDGADDRPWMLVLSWGPPHDPLTPPEEFVVEREIEMPPSVPHRVRDYAAVQLPLYYGLIESIDHEFGRLVAALDERGLADDTIVVYTSDHGNLMGSHGLWGKELPYSDSSQVPFLIRWPKQVTAGATVGTPFGAPDVFPSLASLAGLTVPDGVHGKDLADALRGADTSGRKAIYLSAVSSHASAAMEWPAWRGVRTDRFLFARTRRRPWLLYDLLEDPYERRNRVVNQKDTRTKLSRLTKTFMERLGDSWDGAPDLDDLDTDEEG